MMPQAETDSYTVELTHTQAQAKTLLDGLLELRTRERRSSLTTLYQKGSYFPTNFDRMPAPPIAVACLSLSLHSLLEPIHRCAVHGNFALGSRLLDFHPLLYQFHDLTLACLTLFRSNDCGHCCGPPHLLINTLCAFSEYTITRRRCLVALSYIYPDSLIIPKALTICWIRTSHCNGLRRDSLNLLR